MIDLHKMSETEYGQYRTKEIIRYAQMAIDKLEEKLRNIGIKKIIMDVSVNNEAAIQFYHKLGYTITNYRMKKSL
jgi:ribosomal protein S18 acetylase RimI-like enzyme